MNEAVRFGPRVADFLGQAVEIRLGDEDETLGEAELPHEEEGNFMRVKHVHLGIRLAKHGQVFGHARQGHVVVLENVLEEEKSSFAL